MPRKEIEVKVIRRLNQDTRIVCVSIQIRRQTHKQKVVPWTEDEKNWKNIRSIGKTATTKWDGKEKRRIDGTANIWIEVLSCRKRTPIPLFYLWTLIWWQRIKIDENSILCEMCDIHARACINKITHSIIWKFLEIRANETTRQCQTSFCIVDFSVLLQ